MFWMLHRISSCSQLLQSNIMWNLQRQESPNSSSRDIRLAQMAEIAWRGAGRTHVWSDALQNTEVESYCTQICSKSFAGQSCAKTVSVRLYSQSQPSIEKICYAMIDDPSNQSLATPLICDYFKDNCTRNLHICCLPVPVNHAVLVEKWRMST